MDAKSIKKVTADIKKKYPNAGIKSIEIDEEKGTSTFLMEPNNQNQKALAYLKPDEAVIPHISGGKEKAATITRDAVSRGFLDLAGKDPYTSDPKDLMKRADQYYFTEPIVGSATNLLAAMCAKGFEHDVDDPDVKNFYDTWALDVGLEEVIEWIFLEFFKTGNVYTYKAIAKYEPRVSNISPSPGTKNKKVNPNKAKGRIKEIEAAFAKEIEAIIEELRKAAKQPI